MMRRVDPIVVGFCLVSALFLTVKVVPILWGLTLGFTASSAFSPTPVFVGLENFALVLGDRAFWSALGVGAVYAVATTVLQVVIGVAAALLLFKHGGPASRSMALLPYMIPAVTGVLAWRWISDGLYGIVNHLLLGWGVIAQPISFATSPGWAMPLVMSSWASPSAKCSRSPAGLPRWVWRSSTNMMWVLAERGNGKDRSGLGGDGCVG